MQSVLQKIRSTSRKNAYVPAATVTKISDEIKVRLEEKLLSSKFTHVGVVPYIQNCRFQLDYSHPNFDVHVVVPGADYVPRFLLDRVVYRLSCITHLHTLRDKLTIWLIPADLPRTFPGTERDVITAKNINGGYTYSNNGEVYVYRLEEFPKVLMHEVIHKTELDTSEKWDAKKVATLKRLLNIDAKTNLIVNEAVVETHALIYHLCFLSMQLGMSLQMLYDTELEWSRRQTLRILSKQGRLPGRKWCEDTNAYCYVVLKYFLLYNVKEFLRIGTGDVESIYNLLMRECKNVATLQPQNSSTNVSLRMTVFGDL
jgi:hypothetical protein